MSLTKLVWLGSLLVVLVLPAKLLAQNADQKSNEPYRRIVEMVRLNHVGSEEVCRVIKELEFPVNCAWSREGVVMLAGTANDIASVRGIAIAPMDVPDVRADDQTRFIPVGRYPDYELLELARQLVGSESNPFTSTKVALDSVNHNLIVRGSEEDIRRIEELVAAVARPTRQLTVHMFFLRAAIGSRFTPDAKDLPAGLAPVAETLAANGYGRLSLLSTLMVAVDEGRDFESQSELVATGENEAEDRLRIALQGKAQLDSATNTVQLTVEVNVDGEYSNQESNGETNFEVATTVAASLGDFVILTAAPSTTSTGDAIAVVVRVTGQ